MAQVVENPPAMWEAWVQSLGWEDPLEEEMAPNPVYLPGESPWTGEPGRLQSMGSQRVGHDRATKTHLFTHHHHHHTWIPSSTVQNVRG